MQLTILGASEPKDSLGVQESRSLGVLEFGSPGVWESWSLGVPESGSPKTMNCTFTDGYVLTNAKVLELVQKVKILK